jgi:GNAT superfamily N-acetyltransferase
MTVAIETLTGAALGAALDDLSRLRIRVLHEWPYLYEGDMDYERGYLAQFAATPDSIIVAARDGDSLVGAATAAPLAGHTDGFVPLFEAHGFDPEAVFYCGESVLLPAYRGQGLGHAFFDHRERHARALVAGGARFSHVTFCGVVRPGDHPMRSTGYRPLDGFWRKRGYEPVAGLVGSLAWRDIGHTSETEKAMQFWMKPL